MMGTSMESAAWTIGRPNRERTIETNMTLLNPEGKDTINQDLTETIGTHPEIKTIINHPRWEQVMNHRIRGDTISVSKVATGAGRQSGATTVTD